VTFTFTLYTNIWATCLGYEADCGYVKEHKAWYLSIAFNFLSVEIISLACKFGFYKAWF